MCANKLSFVSNKPPAIQPARRPLGCKDAGGTSVPTGHTYKSITLSVFHSLFPTHGVVISHPILKRKLRYMFSLGNSPHGTSPSPSLSRSPSWARDTFKSAGSSLTCITGAAGFPFDHSQVLTIQEKPSRGDICFTAARDGQNLRILTHQLVTCADCAGPCLLLSLPHAGDCGGLPGKRWPPGESRFNQEPCPLAHPLSQSFVTSSVFLWVLSATLAL